MYDPRHGALIFQNSMTCQVSLVILNLLPHNLSNIPPESQSSVQNSAGE